VELWPVGLLPDPAVDHGLSLIASSYEAISAPESLHGQQRHTFLAGGTNVT